MFVEERPGVDHTYSMKAFSKELGQILNRILELFVINLLTTLSNSVLKSTQIRYLSTFEHNYI